MVENESRNQKRGLEEKVDIESFATSDTGVYIPLTLFVNNLHLKRTVTAKANKYLSSLLRRKDVNFEGDYREVRYGFHIHDCERVRETARMKLLEAGLYIPSKKTIQGMTVEKYNKIMSIHTVDPVAYLREVIRKKYNDP